MSAATMSAFAPILKWDDNGDGTINVYGQVSGPELDRDKQEMDATYLKSALPQWFSEGANLREQHNGKIVAGVGIELSEGDAGRYFLKSHVIDSGTVAKVKAKALTGYSVAITGGRVVKSQSAPAGRIVGGTIYEVSLVDRPSNPHCGVVIVKAAGGGELELADAIGATWENEDEMLTLPEYKAAVAAVDTLLSGRAADAWVKSDGGAPIDAIEDTVAQVAGLIAHEAAELAGADLTKGFDASTLMRAVESLATLVEPGSEGSYVGADSAWIRVANGEDGAELVKAAFTGYVAYRTGATIGEDGEILKAAGTVPTSTESSEGIEILKAEIATLRSQLSKVESAPRAGGPSLVRLPATAPITKSSNASLAGQARTIQRNPNVSPEIARVLEAAAVAAEQGGAS